MKNVDLQNLVQFNWRTCHYVKVLRIVARSCALETLEVTQLDVFSAAVFPVSHLCQLMSLAGIHTRASETSLHMCTFYVTI